MLNQQDRKADANDALAKAVLERSVDALRCALEDGELAGLIDAELDEARRTMALETERKTNAQTGHQEPALLTSHVDVCWVCKQLVVYLFFHICIHTYYIYISLYILHYITLYNL